MTQPQNQTLFIKHKQLNLQPFQLTEDTMTSGRNWERWLKDFGKQAQYYGIWNPEEKKQALLVFGGREVTICEDSLPDLDNNGDAYERMVQKLSNDCVTEE